MTRGAGRRLATYCVHPREAIRHLRFQAAGAQWYEVARAGLDGLVTWPSRSGTCPASKYF